MLQKIENTHMLSLLVSPDILVRLLLRWVRRRFVSEPASNHSLSLSTWTTLCLLGNWIIILSYFIDIDSMKLHSRKFVNVSKKISLSMLINVKKLIRTSVSTLLTNTEHSQPVTLETRNPNPDSSLANLDSES
jgi:hypothetical protein